MKSILLYIIPLFFTSHGFAQDTVVQKNKLTDSVIERFYVLKSNKEIKEGPYQALFQRKTVIAAGYYNNNKKIGSWHFYDKKGKLVQRYNYGTNAITYLGPWDFGSDVHFLFDEKMKANDRVTRPLKIGGEYYGYIPYVNLFHLPFETFGINTNYFDAYIELVVSPLGRLADYKVHVTSTYYEYDHSFNMDVGLFSEEDRTFVPATLNNQPVLSRIIIKCFVDGDSLDFY